MRETVAVIGAGIAGLTCAYELFRAGIPVLVLERERQPGGRMRTRRRDDLAFDMGANFLVKAYSRLSQLARHLGVELRDLSPVRHALYRNGKLQSINFESARDLLRMDALHLPSKLRFLDLFRSVRRDYPDLDFFDLSSAPEELRLEDAYSFARQRVDHEFADYIVDAFHSCMMFSRSSESSAAALMALLSMKTNPDHDFSICHARQEMQEIPDAIAAQIPLHPGCAVESVSRGGHGWRVRAVNFDEEFRQVVLATTAGVARRLLANDCPESHRGVLRETGYAATINLAFRMPRDALPELTHCFYIPFRESSLISEFTNEGLKGSNTNHDGWTLVNVGLHDAAARALMALDDGPLFQLVGSELSRLSPVLSTARPHDLQRWPEAIPRYDAGQLSRVKDFLADGQGREGLFLCGDYLNAPWLEGACRCGYRVAGQVMASASKGATPNLPCGASGPVGFQAGGRLRRNPGSLRAEPGPPFSPG